LNAILIVLAPLVFVLTVSGGVHLVNYYFDEVGSRGPDGAASRAMRKGWAPCLLCATTTAIGLASLTVSDIVPVKHFGAFAAIGVMVTVFLLFLVMPGAMDVVSRRFRPRSAGKATAADASGIPSGAGRWRLLVAAIGRWHVGIALFFVVFMLAAGCGLQWLETSVSVRNLLVSQTEALRDYRWLEEHVGPLVPIEIIVHFDRDCQLEMLRRVELLVRVQQEVDKFEMLEGTTSVATFLPPIPEPGGLRNTIRRSILQTRLEGRRLELIASHWLSETNGRQSWRITTRLPALGDVDYGLILERLRQHVDPLLRRDAGVEATYTGIMPLIYEAQRALLRDLFRSFLTAFVLVTIAMTLVLRSVPAGLVAMLPNMFPALVLFGSMGWLRVKADIGSVMTASVALGIAVDGTIHFLSWYRRETAAGLLPQQAVARTFRHCGRAMTQTTIICGLGLLAFAFSGFVPTRRFAWLMLALLMAALAGDLILLPSLLVGPFGGLFAGRTKGSGREV
jgi:predicted RND superfamily exporter protein